MDFWCIFTVIGLLWVARQTVDLLLFLWRRNQSLDGYKYGWAVVTGATDGIGKAICEELLAKGFKTVLVSRSQAKLAAVKQELEAQFIGAQIEVLQADFSHLEVTVEQFYSTLGRKFEQFGEVSVLVNNVGVMWWRKFDQTTMRALLPRMEDRYRKTGERSLIIDLSSNASVVPLPCLAVYGATKAYNAYLSQALSTEVSAGITVLSALPGMVATNMPKMNHVPAQPGTVLPQSFAKHLLQNTGQGTTAGHPSHMARGWLLRYVLDNPLGRYIVSKSAKHIEDTKQK